MKYQQPIGAIANAPYQDGNPQTGTEGSPVPAKAIEAPQREIVHVITSAGLIPDEEDDTQLLQAISVLADGGDMYKAQNLSGLTDLPVARSNLGILQRRGTDIASTATTDIGSADSNYVRISGTTTITSLGTGTARDFVIVEFSGACIITHHASNLILPGAVNITTAAGDVLCFARRGAAGSSSWKCVGGVKADGTPLFLAAHPDFAQSLAANGWKMLPGGLIMQWGTTADLVNGVDTVVSLPRSFPTAGLFGVAGGANNVAVNQADFAVMAIGATTITLRNTNGSTNRNARWMAFGS